jgi:23S rRNA 5-hydroxycytidine C2501 synthase
VVRIDPKTLRAADVADCALMTCKYCIQAQLDIGPKMSSNAVGLAEPLP